MPEAKIPMVGAHILLDVLVPCQRCAVFRQACRGVLHYYWSPLKHFYASYVQDFPAGEKFRPGFDQRLLKSWHLHEIPESGSYCQEASRLQEV